MRHDVSAIPDQAIPRATDAIFQHVVDTYASEANKLITTWQHFEDADLSYRPHPKSSPVADILMHELLSERRFFAEFLGMPEPDASAVLPAEVTVDAYIARFEQLARPRLRHLASRTAEWWLELVPFFDVRRQRIWVFWRRVLHTAHHRTQLTVYLRMMGRPVPAIYGPSADESWSGADPTQSLQAAQRR